MHFKFNEKVVSFIESVSFCNEEKARMRKIFNWWVLYNCDGWEKKNTQILELVVNLWKHLTLEDTQCLELIKAWECGGRREYYKCAMVSKKKMFQITEIQPSLVSILVCSFRCRLQVSCDVNRCCHPELRPLATLLFYQATLQRCGHWFLSIQP